MLTSNGQIEFHFFVSQALKMSLSGAKARLVGMFLVKHLMFKSFSELEKIHLFSCKKLTSVNL